MPFLFVIPGPLRELADNRAELRLEGRAGSVTEALALLWAAYPALRDRVLTERGAIRPHMSVFVDGEDIRFIGGLDAPVRDGAEVFLVPALSGG